MTGGVLLYRHTAGRGNAAASLYIGYVCSCERIAGARGASPIRPTLADGRSPSSSISACSVFARLPCRIMDGRELSEGELESVARAVGGIDAVIDPKAKDADTVALVQYLAADQKFEKVLDNQQILREPIVRNGRQATVGYEPDVWKGWE